MTSSSVCALARHWTILAGEIDARIIPIDQRAPLPSRHQLWNGDPRGHWEGDTLVVETGNFNSLGWISTSQAGGRIKGIRHTDQLRVVERFSRSDEDDTLLLTATIEDGWSLREPVVIKKIWRWAPEQKITPYDACEPATEFSRGKGE